MILICMLSSSLNTMLLIFNYEEMKENARITAKEFDNDGNAAELFENCRILKIQLVEFLKLDLGMEVFYQVSLQIILLLFTQTKTPTTGGWESFFEQDSYLGLPLHPETILALSATWSLKTCIFLHIKTISVEKGFFTVTSRMAVFCWALFATLRKVLSNLAFFTPSLGLFSLLHHWQAEQIYFKSPYLLAKKFNKAPVQIPQFDK